MRKTIITLSLLFAAVTISAQPAGYYNGTEGKTGEELKDSLNNIISGHIDYSYSQAKYLINWSDADPANPDKVILFYTQRSQDADTYGSGGDYINREHVWAKSHGDFSGKNPMDGDAFNLRPADASVNMQRSNLDFDECSTTGTEITEAPGTYYTSNQWEPADAVKGQVARIIFYMATRYEGENGEMDLEPADALDTYPTPTHGKLSTLLQWNRDFPPTAFEYRRNERLYGYQNNRNPFIDNPGFADLIWGGAAAPSISLGEMNMEPALPYAGESTNISLNVQSSKTLTGVSLYWGDVYDSENNNIVMTASGNTYSGNLSLSGFSTGETVYYKIIATDGSNTETLRASYTIHDNIPSGALMTIKEVQGTGASSPYINQTVATSGIVTANLDNTFYIQDSNDPYSGIAVFGSKTAGRIGDSIVLTAKVSEYSGLTELVFPDYAYVYTGSSEPQAIEISISQINESYEGMLVTIRNAQFSNGGTIIPGSNETYAFSDGTGTINLYSKYSSRLVGHELPSGTVDVTGIVSQHNDDYQILARDINDLAAGEDVQGPQLTDITVQSEGWLMVDFNEKLDTVSAETVSNYSINNGISVLGAYLYENSHVSLNISGLSSGTHTLTASGIKDLVGNVTDNDSFDFTYTSTEIPSQSEGNMLNIHPNPANNILYVDIETLTAGNAEIDIYNMTGKLLISTSEILEPGNNFIKLNISDLQKGLYIVKVNAGKNYVKKLIVD